jgi:predicted DNA-binding ribbon-helix-helix protein
MPELANDEVLLRRGRPSTGRKHTTVARSVRLPESLWKDLESAAKTRRLNVHQVMRAALLGWLKRAG